MRKVLLLTFLFALITTLGFSQSGKYWSAHVDAGKITTDKAVARLSFPKAFKLFDLNTEPLRQELFTVTGNTPLQHSTIISLPNADGGMEEFEVFEASNFEPALQTQFPMIRAFSGKGITDRYATLKLSISPQGIQTMVFRTDKENEFIEAYSADHTVYAVFKSQRKPGQLSWTCSTQEEKMVTGLNSKVFDIGNSNFTGSSTGELKTMRLAQSCTGEYSNFFGATSAAQVALVLAGFNATLTRCNGCYERDLALHLNLIPETVSVIFYDGSSDPYSPPNIGTDINNANNANGWNIQLQNTLSTTLGPSIPASNALYDIGHLFGKSGGGGNAGCIGCVCVDPTATGQKQKGSGYTSPGDGIPQGDNFDIDFVVHEVGHQLGGNHTFSFALEGTGVNKEVASGITIMAYAGVAYNSAGTVGYNVAPHSIDIFHEASIQQIQNNLAIKTCPVTTNISAVNATPVVAPVSNYTIPVSTPFALTGSATDLNAGDALTYCWEQNDNSTTTALNSAASPTKVTGPNWLSFSPTASPVRLCPRLSTILAGNPVTGPLAGGDVNINTEALSSVARTLNFRLTVRDNSPYSSTIPIKVGQTAFTDMTVTVASEVGPFLITTQNSAVSYVGSSTQTVTWSVSNTTGPPTNTANVKISWSSDNGNTFTTLIGSTANDGTESIVIPTGATTTGRIKVEAIGNIYFDINNAPITVTVPPTGFTLTAPANPTTVACGGGNTATATIGSASQGGFSTPINLAVTSTLPAGITATSFAPNPVAPGSSSVLTITGVAALTPGTYNFTITGTAGALTQTTTATFIVSAGTGPVITTHPASIAVCAPATTTFTSASSTAGVAYKWQVATAAAPTVFTDIPGAVSATYTTPATTAAMNGNIYHVIISTQCGSTTSNNATLTVNTAAAIAAQPTNQSACTGNTATFTVGATGTGVTYQWYSATASGGPYTPIAAATGSSYTTPAVTGTTPGFYQVIVTTTTCPGSVTSSAAQLTISTTTAIGTQPTSQSVCMPAAATFSVAAAGTGLSYQWQVATAAAPTVFTNVGTNSNTFSTGATTTAMNGNIYHVIVTGTCNAVTSANVTLTVNTAAAITSQPTDVTVCNGTPASFTVGVSGTGATVKWQSATAVGGPYTDIAGATSATYTIASTTPAMNGTYYHAVVTTTTCPGTVTSANVLLTVNTVAVIGTQPANQSACVPNTATFTVAATGTGLGYQWQVATAAAPTVFTSIGTNSASYTTPVTTFAMNGNLYRVLVSSTCAPGNPITSNTATLTVNNPVTVTQNPVAQSGCTGDNYTFSVTATSSGAITYQWQSSFDDITYTNIAGATNAAYTITGATSLQNGTYYRVIVSGAPCGQVTTPGAKLTLSYRASIVLTAGAPLNGSTINTNPAHPAGLYTTVSPAGNYVYGWKRNGAVIPNLTPSLTAANGFFDEFGSYQVTVTDITTGCVATSNVVTISDIAAERDRLFISPNPTRDVVYVSYYNGAVTAQARTIGVYDSKGSKMMVKSYNPSGTYGQMKLDLSGLTKGVYMIELRDAAGKKIAGGGVVKL